MKQVLFFAATAIIFASCSNNQGTTDKATIDSMSQELAKQHIIDSMNSVSPVVGASPAEVAPAPVQHQSAPTHSQRSHSHSVASSGNGSSGGAAPVNTVAPAVSNTSTQPTAEELAAKKKAANKKLVNSTAAGAMIGAGAGAIGGAVAGKNDHFKKEDAVIGGAAGAVVGGAAGYLLQKRKQKRDTTK